MRLKDIKDWYVMLHMGGMLTASTIFVFLHPTYFPMWATFVGTVGGIFHWLIIKDKQSGSTPSQTGH